MSANFSVLILAAGSSSRMGTSKQLLKIESEPLLVRTVRVALETKPEITVTVLGAKEQEHKAVIAPYPVSIFFHREWERGMGSSLKAGLKYLVSIQPATDGVIILVCDQPLLTSSHIALLFEKHKKAHKPVIASWYAGSPGVPAYFHKSFFDKLFSIDDEAGAKAIFRKYPEFVETVDFPEGSIDIDTAADYENFKRRSQ
jgi:molybdenum cofactor cytidylyltransferase